MNNKWNNLIKYIFKWKQIISVSVNKLDFVDALCCPWFSIHNRNRQTCLKNIAD